jgi:hypothetical protein
VDLNETGENPVGGPSRIVCNEQGQHRI